MIPPAARRFLVCWAIVLVLMVGGGLAKAHAGVPRDHVMVDGEAVPYTLDLDNYLRLAQCESGRRWHIQGTYRGGLQFTWGTWRSVGGTGDPALASVAEQIARARELVTTSGWHHWPGCSRKLGFR